VQDAASRNASPITIPKGDADFVYASALGLETWLVYTRLLRVYIGVMDGPLAIEAQS